MPKRYYSLEKSGTEADLYIFGNITQYRWREKDTDAYGIVKELEELEVDTVNVHINSYGGDVSEGLAIYNVLKNKGVKVITYCDSFACSAASVVFMAGDERIMNEASLLMVHNPWTYMRGNAKDFRKQADDMDKIAQASVKAYMSRVNISEEKLKKMLDDESWITAEDAKEYGFATKVLGQDDEGVRQSALETIRSRILNHAETKQIHENGEILGKRIAGMILQELSPILEKATEERAHTPNSGWSAFFNTEKGE